MTELGLPREFVFGGVHKLGIIRHHPAKPGDWFFAGKAVRSTVTSNMKAGHPCRLLKWTDHRVGERQLLAAVLTNLKGSIELGQFF